MKIVYTTEEVKSILAKFTSQNGRLGDKPEEVRFIIKQNVKEGKFSEFVIDRVEIDYDTNPQTDVDN